MKKSPREAYQNPLKSGGVDKAKARVVGKNVLRFATKGRLAAYPEQDDKNIEDLTEGENWLVLRLRFKIRQLTRDDNVRAFFDRAFVQTPPGYLTLNWTGAQFKLEVIEEILEECLASKEVGYNIPISDLLFTAKLPFESESRDGNEYNVFTALMLRNNSSPSDLTGKQARETIDRILSLAQRREEASKTCSTHVPEWNSDLTSKNGFVMSEVELNDYHRLLGFIKEHVRNTKFTQLVNTSYLLEVECRSDLCCSLGIVFWRGVIGYKKRLSKTMGFTGMATKDGNGIKFTFSLTNVELERERKVFIDRDSSSSEIQEDLVWDTDARFEDSIRV